MDKKKNFSKSISDNNDQLEQESDLIVGIPAENTKAQTVYRGGEYGKTIFGSVILVKTLDINIAYATSGPFPV